MKSCRCLLLMLVSVIGLATYSKPVVIPVTVTLQRPDDTCRIRVLPDATLLDICSPFGIGRASIELKTARWPKRMMLRLHLTGLENLRISNGALDLGAAISSGEGTLHPRVWKYVPEEIPLDPRSPESLQIRVRNRAGRTADTLPLDDGYFEVELPAIMLQEASSLISVQWIDYYRV